MENPDFAGFLDLPHVQDLKGKRFAGYVIGHLSSPSGRPSLPSRNRGYLPTDLDFRLAGEAMAVRRMDRGVWPPGTRGGDLHGRQQRDTHRGVPASNFLFAVHRMCFGYFGGGASGRYS